MPERLEQRLLAKGFKFYRWRHDAMAEPDQPAKGEVLCRMVCSYQTQAADVDHLIAAAAR